jgi:hypothetical protein
VAKAEDPTAPRADDPECENGDGRAEAIVHDDDGTKHYLCAGCAWRRQQEQTSPTAGVTLSAGEE